MVKIIDAFIFYNEIDLLKYRFEILYNIVDYFIIVESTCTFMGYKKPLYYVDHKSLFTPYQEKIIHILVDDFPHKQPHVDIYKADQWYNERFQRSAMMRGVQQIEHLLEECDYLLFSDVDEIPNPLRLSQIKSGERVIQNHIAKLEQDLYYYNLETLYSEKWYRVKILSYHFYKELKERFGNEMLENIRNEMVVDEMIDKGGWHLSFFGDESFIQNKLQHFSHQDLNIPLFRDPIYIQEKIKNHSDLFGRNISFLKVMRSENTNLPPLYETFFSHSKV
jgi:beta-1,4-mannosyl-glycoprotein beta-1,4-N-acetylglucosaminyltransferase